MRYTVLHGCLWDGLYIGFQNRISRDPDVYHHKYPHPHSHVASDGNLPRCSKMNLLSASRFWNHFQIHLPLSRPDWDGFLQGAAPVHEPDAAEESSSCVVL